MEKTGAITDKTPDAERERKSRGELEKKAQLRDASKVLKSEHKPTTSK